MPTTLLCYCRPGFEPELAAELGEKAAHAGFPGYARTERDSGLVRFVCEAARALLHAVPLRELIFARQVLLELAELRELPPHDRVGAIAQALEGETRYGEVSVEHADSDAARPLATLARPLGNALRGALRKAGVLTARPDAARDTLHVVLLSGTHAVLASSSPDASAPWPMGIPRLRMHADAPSRSALKLEEAFLTLLSPAERAQRLREGMHAADLGAAPGGWTWVLVRNGLFVQSIDNGPLRPALLESGRVEHLRADGFAWQPRRRLDWMVCDMVEQPRRVASRMATWLREGWCTQSVFNLKLPMKKRWDETRRCLDIVREESALPLRLRARQLYHDREEITVYAAPRG